MQTLNLKLVKNRSSTIKYNQMHNLKYTTKIKEFCLKTLNCFLHEFSVLTKL